MYGFIDCIVLIILPHLASSFISPPLQLHALQLQYKSVTSTVNDNNDKYIRNQNQIYKSTSLQPIFHPLRQNYTVSFRYDVTSVMITPVPQFVASSSSTKFDLTKDNIDVSLHVTGGCVLIDRYNWIERSFTEIFKPRLTHTQLVICR